MLLPARALPLSRVRTAPLAVRIVLADQDGQQRVVAQAVVVDEVFVAEAEAEDALLEQIGQGVLDEFRIAVVGEAAGEWFEEAELGFDLTEEQAAGVGGDGSAVEAGDDFAGAEVLEEQGRGVTGCHGVTASGVGVKVLVAQPLCQLRGRCASAMVRNSG